MARKNKTTETEVGVTDFINAYVDNEQKKADSLQLIGLMAKWSGSEPKMWGPTIIGFGSYHYKYASGHEGDAPLIGFSPRKAEFSLYVFSPTDENKHLLDGLGKFKMGKACLYAKKLADLNIPTLEKLCKTTIAYIKEHHECACKKRKMFTIGQIKAAHEKVKSGTDFPAYIRDIKKLGVTHYETFVSNGNADYYGANEHKVSTGARYDPLTIAKKSNPELFKADLKAHQQGKTDFPTFCADCAKWGIEKWVICMDKMACTYYDQVGNEILVEEIPQ